MICKSVQILGKTLPKLLKQGSNTVILDASGMKVVGEGEWKVKVHGRGRPRKWVKVHLVVDSDTQEIVAEVTTASQVGDDSMTEVLLDQIKSPMREALADGGHDRQEAREAIGARKAKPIIHLISTPENAKYKGGKDERGNAILEIPVPVGDRDAKRLWGKLTGYNRRVFMETAFSAMKRLFGD